MDAKKKQERGQSYFLAKPVTSDEMSSHGSLNAWPADEGIPFINQVPIINEKYCGRPRSQPQKIQCRASGVQDSGEYVQQDHKRVFTVRFTRRLMGLCLKSLQKEPSLIKSLLRRVSKSLSSAY